MRRATRKGAASNPFVPLPAPDHRVSCRQEFLPGYDCGSVKYRGTPADIVAAGILTKGQLNAPSRGGRTKRDAMGRVYSRRKLGGTGLVVVTFSMHRGDTSGMPGVMDPAAWMYRLLRMSNEQRHEFESESAQLGEL